MRLILFLIVLCTPIFVIGVEKPIVILDPGHGGKDEGARVRTLTEKNLALRTSFLAKKHLETLGYRVVMTRARDVFVPLHARVLLANQRDPSLFISIHYNSASTPSAKGIEVYYYDRGSQPRKTYSKALASSVLSQMVLETKAGSRGTKPGNLHVIRETVMPAVLIEAGFITNSEERALIATQPYLDKLAKGIAKGIDKYVKTKR